MADFLDSEAEESEVNFWGCFYEAFLGIVKYFRRRRTWNHKNAKSWRKSRRSQTAVKRRKVSDYFFYLCQRFACSGPGGLIVNSFFPTRRWGEVGGGIEGLDWRPTDRRGRKRWRRFWRIRSVPEAEKKWWRRWFGRRLRWRWSWLDWRELGIQTRQKGSVCWVNFSFWCSNSWFQKKFKRLRRIQDEDSDDEDQQQVDRGLEREQVAEQLFDEEDVSVLCFKWYHWGRQLKFSEIREAAWNSLLSLSSSCAWMNTVALNWRCFLTFFRI